MPNLVLTSAEEKNSPIFCGRAVFGRRTVPGKGAERAGQAVEESVDCEGPERGRQGGTNRSRSMPHPRAIRRALLPSAVLNAALRRGQGRAGHLRGKGRCQGRKEELTLGMWVPVSEGWRSRRAGRAVSSRQCPWHTRGLSASSAGSRALCGVWGEQGSAQPGGQSGKPKEHPTLPAPTRPAQGSPGVQRQLGTQIRETEQGTPHRELSRRDSAPYSRGDICQ